MKTPREIDVLRKSEWFEDTPEIVEWLKAHGMQNEARHVHKMHVYHKALVAEIRRLRRAIRRNQNEQRD